MLTWLRWLLQRVVRLCRTLLRWLGRQSPPRWPSPRVGGPVRRPHAHPKPAWVRREIIRLKALMPEAGCRTLAHCFNRRFAVPKRMTVGKTYVADTIRRQQYVILAARRRLKHAVPRPVPCNLIWGMDLAVKTDLRGRQHLVLAIVEHASRACLCLQRLTDKCTVTVLQSLAETIRQYGRPRFLRTDNEAVFTSWRLRLVLRVLGIRPQHTDPHCPWQNGRVERFIGTVKRVLAPYTSARVQPSSSPSASARAHPRRSLGEGGCLRRHAAGGHVAQALGGAVAAGVSRGSVGWELRQLGGTPIRAPAAPCPGGVCLRDSSGERFSDERRKISTKEANPVTETTR